MYGILHTLFCNTLEMDSVWQFFISPQVQINLEKCRGNSREITYLHTFSAADYRELTSLSPANHSNQSCRRRLLILCNFPMKVCIKTSTFHPFFPNHPLETVTIVFVTVQIHHVHGFNVLAFLLPAQWKLDQILAFRHRVTLSDVSLPLFFFSVVQCMCVRISAVN